MKYERRERRGKEARNGEKVTRGGRGGGEV